jgi:hypothetical protein
MYTETLAILCGWDEDMVRLYRESDRIVVSYSLRMERGDESTAGQEKQ